MNVVNDSKKTSSNNWDVCNLDISSIKMTIDNDNMYVIIASHNFNLAKKNYQIKVKKDVLFISLTDGNSGLIKQAQFLLPNPKFNCVSKTSFANNQLKIILKKAPKKPKLKSFVYEGVA